MQLEIVSRRWQPPWLKSCADFYDQRPQHRYALYNDGACNFGRVPDRWHAETPEVPFIFGVAQELPVCSNCWFDCDDHALSQALDTVRSVERAAKVRYQRHDHTKSDFLRCLDTQVPCYHPWIGGEDEVHDYVIDFKKVSRCKNKCNPRWTPTISALLKVVKEIIMEAKVQSNQLVVFLDAASPAPFE